MTTKIHRTKSRKLLFQELYAMSFNKIDIVSFRESFYDNIFTFTVDDSYIKQMQKIITFRESFFVYIIKTYTPKFRIETMSPIYIIPIYIALSEMFFLTEEISAEISINEAVELAKKYWDDSARKVINWLLNQVFKNYDDLNKIKENDYSDIKESIFKK